MKHFFLILLLIACCMAACNNNRPMPEPNKDLTVGNQAADDKAAALQKLSPYTLDQMKAKLPATLNGAMLTDASANSAMGAPYAKGEYRLNDSTTITLSIFDCAGDEGVGIYNTQFLMQQQMKENEEGVYTKTIDFNGDKAIEHEDREEGTATFVWLANNRILATLEGKNVGMGMVKKTASSLKSEK